MDTDASEQSGPEALRAFLNPDLRGLACAGEKDAVRDPSNGFYHLLQQLAMTYELALSTACRNGGPPPPEAEVPILPMEVDFVPTIPFIPDSPVKVTNGSVHMVMPGEVTTEVRPSTQSKKSTSSLFSGSSTAEKPPRPSAARTEDENLTRPSGASTNRTTGRRMSGTRKISASGFKLRSAWQSNLHFLAQRRVSMQRTKALMCAPPDETVESKSRLQKFVLHPSSQKRFFWDMMCMALLTYDIAVIPFVGAFEPTESSFLIVMMWITMLFWTIDMPVSGFTGFQRRRQTILNPSMTCANYLKTWFFLDFPMVLLDWVLAVLDPGTGASAARLGRSLRTLRFVRTLRLVRLIKLKRILQEIHDQIDTESWSISFGIMKILVVLCVANHVVACGWYAIGKYGTVNWVEFNGMDDRTITYRYTTALHWSLTQFTPASMEIVPHNVEERIYSVIVIIVAMMMFSSFVSILTASMAELRNISNDEARQFWLLRRYFRDWAVSKEVTSRVQDFLEYAYQNQKQRVQEKDVILLTLLSEPLREELKFETSCFHLVAHPLFASIQDTIRMFAKAMERVYLARGDLWFTCGEAAMSMLVLSAGVLEYVLGQDEDTNPLSGDNLPEDVPEGQWVGEAAMWTDWLHLGDLHALIECQAITVCVEKFENLAQHNRPMWQMLQRYAQRFVAELNDIHKSDLTDLTHKLIRPGLLVEASDTARQKYLKSRTASFRHTNPLSTAWKLLTGR